MNRGKHRKKVNILFNGNVDFDAPASVSGIISCTTQIIAKRGFAFHIFCDNGVNTNGNVMQALQQVDEGVFVNRFPWHNLKNYRRVYNWSKILWIASRSFVQKAQINHIYVSPEIELCNIILSPNIPSIFHIESFPESWQGNRWFLAIKKSDVIITCSKFMKNKLLDKYPFSAGKIYVIPNGVDTGLFHPQERSKLRRKLGLAQKHFIVLFSGNIWKVKGFDLILEVANMFWKAKENIDFVIAGGFYPEIDAIHWKWKEYSPPNMHYVGLLPHSQLSEYYAAADIAIAPSMWEEPFGMVIIEAMTSGTPVIASRIGGIPEIIQDGVSGFLIKPGCVEELHEKILWCSENRTELSIISRNAREEGQNYDWKIVSDKIESVYRRMLHN